MFDLDSIKTILDIGIGATALLYVYKLNKLLERHEVRITNLETKAT